MFWLAELVLLAICACIGAGAGFYKEWRKGPPPPVTIVYCEPFDTDTRCVEARKRYNAEHPTAPAPADSGGTPR